MRIKALIDNANLIFLALFLGFGGVFFFLVWFPGVFLLFALFFGVIGTFSTLNEFKLGRK